MAGINQEIWTDVLVKDFKAVEAAGFLKEIPDESRHVSGTKGENQIIHLVDVGGLPEVIINNITYPIGYESRNDGNIPIELDTFVTKATKVTQEEIENITYDKIRDVQKDHKDAIMLTKHIKAVHALGSTTETATTPILVTTGPDDGTGRKRLILKDVLTHKTSYDNQKIPLQGRTLILSSEHYNDLLLEAINAKKSDNHLSFDEAGLLKTRLFGFKTWHYVDNPYYNLATLTKKTFGSINTAGDVQASISYYSRDMFRASGLTKNYSDEPTTQNHARLYNARHNYIVLPRKQRAIGAIISAII